MSGRSSYRLICITSLIILTFLISGCANNLANPAVASSTTSTVNPPTQTAAEPTVAPSATPTIIPPTQEVATSTPEQSQVADTSNVLYHDGFTDPTSGWPEEKFDNYFIGYHEPEYYHVEIVSPNYKTTVFEPEKKSFGDVTIEVKVFTAASRTAETGDFSFGIAFRRSGDNYYAFTISQRTKKWYVLKNSPDALTVLAEGTDESIHGFDEEDVLRVDSQGSNFAFYVNDRLVSQLTDGDYATGEAGFFVQTFDAERVHIHYDELTISNFAGTQLQGAEAVLYHDGFTDPTSGWPEEKFDNYFIGYHEPEYYHVEIVSPNYKTTVFEPEKKSFGDVTIEVKVFTAASKTAETGDFSFGIAFRRSGDNYYAFTISQRTKKWYVLKSSPSALTVLAEGTDESIHGFDEEDVLRVDSQGSNFAFYVNDHPVSQLTDADYATGEVGFYVQTYDAARVHIHYDELTISAYKSTLACDVRALTLHVRSGPGTQYPPFSFLVNGDTIIPIGISEDGEWLYVNLVGNESQGWVFNSPSFLTCNAPVEGLPVTHP